MPTNSNLAKENTEPAFAGCVVSGKKCQCYSAKGAPVEVEPDICQDHLARIDFGNEKAKEVNLIAESPDPARADGDASVLSFMNKPKTYYADRR